MAKNRLVFEKDEEKSIIIGCVVSLLVVLAVVLAVLAIRKYRGNAASQEEIVIETITETLAEDGSTIVQNQQELEEKLTEYVANPDTPVSITIQSSEEQSIEISEAEYPGVSLTVDAPYTEVNNSAQFAAVTINQIAASTWVENGSGNSFTVNASSSHMVISEDAYVSLIENKGYGSSFCIEVYGTVDNMFLSADSSISSIWIKGSVGQLSVLNTTYLTLSGEKTELTSVSLEGTANGSTVSASLPVSIDGNCQCAITLEAGAEGSQVMANYDYVETKITNNTNEVIVAINSAQEECEVAVGETVTLGSSETALDYDSSSETTETTALSSTGGSSYGGSSSYGGGSSSKNSSTSSTGSNSSLESTSSTAESTTKESTVSKTTSGTTTSGTTSADSVTKTEYNSMKEKLNAAIEELQKKNNKLESEVQEVESEVQKAQSEAQEANKAVQTMTNNIISDPVPSYIKNANDIYLFPNPVEDIQCTQIYKTSHYDDFSSSEIAEYIRVENSGEDGKVYNVKLVFYYFDEQGNWVSIDTVDSKNLQSKNSYIFARRGPGKKEIKSVKVVIHIMELEEGEAYKEQLADFTYQKVDLSEKIEGQTEGLEITLTAKKENGANDTDSLDAIQRLMGEEIQVLFADVNSVEEGTKTSYTGLDLFTMKPVKSGEYQVTEGSDADGEYLSVKVQKTLGNQVLVVRQYVNKSEGSIRFLVYPDPEQVGENYGGNQGLFPEASGTLAIEIYESRFSQKAKEASKAQAEEEKKTKSEETEKKTKSEETETKEEDE